MNEQETRFFLIDPVLRDKGYNDHQWLKMETPAPVEPTGSRGRRRKGAGRTDYLLCVQVGNMPKPLPVGVLEAKAADIDAAVFDLKAVNPNTVAKVDKRTPQEIIRNIEAQGKIVANSLSKLSKLLNEG